MPCGLTPRNTWLDRAVLAARVHRLQHHQQRPVRLGPEPILEIGELLVERRERRLGVGAAARCARPSSRDRASPGRDDGPASPASDRIRARDSRPKLTTAAERADSAQAPSDSTAELAGGGAEQDPVGGDRRGRALFVDAAGQRAHRARPSSCCTGSACSATLPAVAPHAHLRGRPRS